MEDVINSEKNMQPQNENHTVFKLFQDYQKMGMDMNPLFAEWFSPFAKAPGAAQQLGGDFQAWWDFYADCQKKWIDPKSKVNHEIADKRFKDPLWQENPSFYLYHQFYLRFAKQLMEWIQMQPSADPKQAKQLQFMAKQYLDAMSPANFPLTNPEVINQTIASQGENLRQGMQNWLNDLTRQPGYFQIQMTDMTAFELGKNIAVTKGKVIFQNRLMQLIQYEPTTEKVYEKPLLIIPPWINKYYILDLTEKKSLVKWLVDQGFTVFMISWVNPDKSYKDTGFDNYLSEGVLTAIDAIEAATQQKSINALGFCIGGTLLAVAIAYLKAKQSSAISSATFLTSLIDFSEPGEIGVFIDENQLSNIEHKMTLDGYFDGRAMMNAFNMLRANDLQWSYYVNHYLRGQKPFPFDLLYWNCDPTNLPAKMHSFYLRNFYLENRLCKPNGLSILNQPLNLNQVDIPCYFLSTAQDHIAPWQSTFKGAQCLGDNVTFVLGGSGHIAGVVNPPSAQKYGYQVNSASIKEFSDPLAWLKRASSHEGSWWPHWGAWLIDHAGKKVNKRIPGSGALKIIQDAPGDYVRKRIE